MPNVIGLFNYRSGSTYVFDSIANLLDKHYTKTTWLMEYFNHMHLDMWYLDNNELKYKEYEWKKFRDYVSNLTNKNTTQNYMSNIDINYVIKKNKKNLDLLNKTKYNYVLKVSPNHLIGIDILDLNNLDTKNIKILLKRDDLEDQCLSFLFARETGVFHSKRQYNYKNFTYNSTLHYPSINFIVQQEKKLDKLSKKFKFDFCIKYEDLTGDPYVDFKNILNLDAIKTEEKILPTVIKLMTKEEKIKKIVNYNDFKKDFRTILNE